MSTLDDRYLCIGDIAAGFGVSVDWARRLAARDSWSMRRERTGRPGQQRRLYRVGDARASIAAATARRRAPRLRTALAALAS